MILQHHIQLLPYHSFRTTAVARFFCEPETTEELQQLLRCHPHERKLVIGKGCNLFFTEDFDGLVIRPAMCGRRVVAETEADIDLEVGAGETWDDFVAYCVANGYAGIENLSLIPSSVGAVPFQNIGAYGVEVKDVITRVEAVEIATGEIRTFSNEACGFGYRESLFKRTRGYVITSVTFRLQKSFTYQEKYVDLKRELASIPAPTLAQVREAIISIRRRKLPDYEILPNAGSFFKNPILDGEAKKRLFESVPDAPVYDTGNDRYKTSAAFLIDRAGYKGKRSGNVGIYERHALIVVNYGTPRGSDIVDFMHEVQQAVYCRFGIRLEPEVQIY